VAAAYDCSDNYLTHVALNYTASEVHANFGPLFSAVTPENKALQIEKLQKKFEYLKAHSSMQVSWIVFVPCQCRTVVHACLLLVGKCMHSC
jgi:hypothetical protein